MSKTKQPYCEDCPYQSTCSQDESTYEGCIDAMREGYGRQ